MKEELHQKENHAKWTPLCFFPIFSGFLALMGICFTICFSVSHFLSDNKFLAFPQDYAFNVVFYVLVLGASICLFFDLLHRGKVSHIFFILLFAILFNVYCFYYLIYNVQIGKPVGAVFYCLAFLSSLGADVYYVKKALSGDANLPFWAFCIATWGFFVFGFVANYTFFDTYSFVNGSFSDFIPKDFFFWGNVIGTRMMLFCSIAITSISLKCDFDPHPLVLNELGQVVYEKKDKNK